MSAQGTAGSTRSPLPGARPTIVDVHPYVAGKTVEQVRRELGLESIVKLGSNENPHAPFPEAVAAMTAALEQIHTYPENSFVELRGLIGGLYNRSSDYIAISHGAGGMLETIARLFIQPGDDVVLPAETYGLYREISRFMGGTLREVPVNEDFRIDIAATAAAITERTKVVWLCNPNNPTSTVATSADVTPILDALPADGWLVLDEAYAEFADPAQLPEGQRLLDEGRNVIIVRTFSKAYGLAGARLGYAIAAPETIRAIDTVAEPFNANRIGLAGARATLTEGLDSVAAALKKITAERDRLTRELTRLGCRVAPSHTNFVFAELPGGGGRRAAGADQTGDTPDERPTPDRPDATDVARRDATGAPRPNAATVTDRLLHRGVIVRGAAGWGFPYHLRVSVGTEAENTRFLNTLEEILNG